MATFSLQLFTPFLTSIVSVLVLILVPLLFVISNKTKLIFVPKHERNSRKPLPPEARGAWPIIGHLHLLGGKLLPHKLLAQIADEHGPVFRLNIGVQKAIVVSSSELAKECFVSNDKALTSRPRLLVVDIMGYGDANIFTAPYGSYWRSLRKVVSLELLSNHRLDMLSYVWREEASSCINNLYGFWFKHKNNINSLDGGVLVDLKQWFSGLSMRIIVRIVSGKNYVGREEEITPLQATIEEVFKRLGSFFIGDALPFLRCLDLGGQEKAMKNTAKKMDAILETWLQEHKQMRSSGSEKCGNDFMSVMLSILEGSNAINESDSRFDEDTIAKATCLAMIGGASDTTPVLLTWAISLLLNNRDVLKKAQEELNTYVGNNRRVTESDIPNLVYLQAIVKETLRMYPPAPLSAPREFNEDCVVGGYHVEKGTRLIVNLSKIHCDPLVWEDPMEFRPERFVTTHKDVDVRGRSFELIPFGSGRRMCPGMPFGIRNAHFLLASFLQAFEFSTVDDDTLVDMTESFGLTNMKATPLQVLVAPRLSVDLYDPI